MNIEHDAQNICDRIFHDMIGNDIQFDSPMSNEKGEPMKKFLIYNDFTASGKGIRQIEKFIQDQVLPTYANVHSTVGHCAEITTKYLKESKEILRNYTNAHGNYSIVFHGQGATGGVHKLIQILSIKQYELFYHNLETAYQIKEQYGNDFIEKCQDGIIKNIKEQFNELFLEVNFCYRIKGMNNNYETRCILCKESLDNEGDYHKHIKGDTHLNFLNEYKERPKELFQMHGYEICDFIDVIGSKYKVSTNESLLQLINDYKRFRPVVFFSLYEHNSNSLSWKETKSKIVLINCDYDKFYNKLEEELKEHKDYYIKIGSFTASSNITGLLLDVDLISSLMHKSKGFAFFDYASAAPYLQINLNDPLPDDYRKLLGFRELSDYEKKRCFKDGIFFSPHKFIGGPNTPGVLIIHDRISRNQLKPAQPGGGTVNFVYKDLIDYIQDVELKEESGTPNIIGSIRLGLMISIRQKIPHDFIIKKDEYYIKLFLDELENVPNLYILHDHLLRNMTHIPVFSLMISFGTKFLHPNYICALLNDLFGIQTRPGCSCAPNYGRFLLGFDKDSDKYTKFGKLIEEGFEIFKPGYLRLNLPFFYPEYVIKYVIKAIKFVCENGYLLLGLYQYNIKTGKFWHFDSKQINLSLNLFNFSNSSPNENELYNKKHFKALTPEGLDKIFREVELYVATHSFLRKTFYIKDNLPTPRRNYEPFSEKEESRWFCVYKDVMVLLQRINYLEINNINPDNDIDLNILISTLEEKAKEKKKDWGINYQKKPLTN